MFPSSVGLERAYGPQASQLVPGVNASCIAGPKRVSFLVLACAAALAIGLPTRAEEAAPPTVPVDRLMSLGPLPDIVQGSPSANITIVEYASMTCTHCAAFHDRTWPELKSRYVDSGRVKFILREFPLDPLATAAFMLGRCAGPQKRDLLIDRMFAQQKTWAFVEKPAAPLLALVETLGFTQADFETCLRDRPLYEQVRESRARAEKTFHIESTPTFFVNGRELTGELSIADFDRAIAAATR